MTVTPDEIRRIAGLARLRLRPDEVEVAASELNRILDHMAVLREVDGDTSDLAPQLREPLPSTRSDDADQPDVLLRPPADFAPSEAEGFFVVPPPPGLADPDADAS